MFSAMQSHIEASEADSFVFDRCRHTGYLRMIVKPFGAGYPAPIVFTALTLEDCFRKFRDHAARNDLTSAYDPLGFTINRALTFNPNRITQRIEKRICFDTYLSAIGVGNEQE